MRTYSLYSERRRRDRPVITHLVQHGKCICGTQYDGFTLDADDNERVYETAVVANAPKLRNKGYCGRCLRVAVNRASRAQMLEVA